MSKKYKCIVKVEAQKFLKYHVNNLLSFTRFLDREYPNWVWFNVYDVNTKKQITNYTKFNKPRYKTVIH